MGYYVGERCSTRYDDYNLGRENRLDECPGWTFDTTQKVTVGVQKEECSVRVRKLGVLFV